MQSWNNAGNHAICISNCTLGCHHQGGVASAWPQVPTEILSVCVHRCCKSPKVDLTRLAELMDCPHERKNIRGAIECLRKANATDMVRYSSIIITNSFLRVIVISL